MGSGPSSEIGQVVLVTGCSQGGIGHELAKELAKRGCKVVASARSMLSMNSLVDLPGIHCLCLDVTDSASVQQAVENVVKKYGRLDVLVNNAGTSCPGPVAELPLDLLQGTFQTNVFGAIRTIQASIPYMVAQGSGRVVNIGSVAAYLPSPWVGGYAASKCALHALTDSLRLELKPFNIDVILVVPGAVASNFGSNALNLVKEPTWRLYKPFEQAIRARAIMSQGPRATPADAFARKAAEVILRKSPPRYFVHGHMALPLSVMYYAPLWFRDFVLMKVLRIGKKVHPKVE